MYDHLPKLSSASLHGHPSFGSYLTTKTVFMDCFSRIQHEQFFQLCHSLRKQRPRSTNNGQVPGKIASRLFARFCREAEATPPGRSAARAVTALIFLNVPLMLNALAVRNKAYNGAQRELNQSLLQNLVVSVFPQQRAAYISSKVARDVSGFAQKWAYSSATWYPAQWHTLITTHFLHLDPWHLIVNMAALAGFGRTCARRPGVNAFHIAAITLGSCLCSSLATLIEKTYISPGDKWLGLGASGVVCAFAAVAVLSDPAEKVHRRVGPIEISISQWAVLPLYFLGDVIGLLKPFQPSGRLSRPVGSQRHNIGHSAHLGGALFGAAYYWLVLRASCRDSARRSDEELVSLVPPVEVTTPTPNECRSETELGNYV